MKHKERKREQERSSKSPRKNDVISIRIFELIFLSFLVFNFSFVLFLRKEKKSNSEKKFERKTKVNSTGLRQGKLALRPLFLRDVAGGGACPSLLGGVGRVGQVDVVELAWDCR